MHYENIQLGKYLNLKQFCTCTQTYQKYSPNINPYPQNHQETIPALQQLNQFIIDPIIDYFGIEKFQLTYGFCSPDLKKYLEQKDPITGEKNGRVAPNLDQHMSHEINKNGKYYCERLGAACDFLIIDLPSNQLVDWILRAKLPFDSLYFYHPHRPIHISYGQQHKRDIWTFNDSRQPTKKGIENWLKLAKEIK
ncbi:hypothetical protein B6N60_02405 [Richelia sinica FACHB-800]|uniref:Peptidase M15A C-terminal domain-containing protein n=1 Tax=Richelia sinica FACHB-800 TaxID=1357546 RepID=A0A975Y501_9NOST|nr:hypothetical protein [Richelia sinica]MBD2665223.1 hypothetical protein [Richelia sinica FACHB-800]QXE23715.1 hypothetical protein B6N60_02405 [Richelia sinica FACHB-800]